MATKKTTSTEPKPKITRTRKTATTVNAETSFTSTPAAKGPKVDVFDLSGKVVTTLILPELLFGAKVNKQLVAQAVRVYLANQRMGTQSTKTRGEVEGSTRKIYRQKGTGRARHGGIRAPIFVGGGIALGPKPRDYSRDLPQKMRRAALASALTVKLDKGEVKVVDGLETITPKTKLFVGALSKLQLDAKNKKLLVILPTRMDNVQKAVRNVEGVSFVLANQLNTYQVMNARKLLVMRSAIDTLEKTFVKKEAK
ncbi:MAG TPA: 50S ribosomal protein L4 [Patescibacteria group bacterium]|nr:50S ribosomal protein L4 [Patescibacteria group bacterium]